MINRNMPELLFVEILPFDIDSYPDGDVVTYTGSTHSEIVKNPVEYVRADLVTGDDNEPLEDGQYRWVGIMFSSEQWEVAQVFSLGGDFVFQVGRLSHRKDTVAKIGPVIRPPEGEV